MIPLLAEANLPLNYFDGLDIVMLLLRVAFGCILAAHGLNKFFGGGKIPGTAGWFDSMGMRPGKVHALAAASTETGAGILMVLGLLTPLAAAAYVALMIVAGYTVHRENGFWSAKSGYELNAIFAIAAVGVAGAGPGRKSLDWALGLDFAFKPMTALAIAVILGVVAGVGQLAVFYRPPASDK